MFQHPCRPSTEPFAINDDDIDLDRVVIDPDYRRHVIAYLNSIARLGRDDRRAMPRDAARGRHSFATT